MRPRISFLLLISYSGVLHTQVATPDRSVFTDGSRLALPGGHIWYRVTGRGAGTPTILLHGGPGNSSVYLKSLEALGDQRIVVRYDQLGAGYSDVVRDTALFNIPHFVEELERLRRHLALDRVHLYGHSWGATLAVEYYRAHPERGPTADRFLFAARARFRAQSRVINERMPRMRTNGAVHTSAPTHKQATSNQSYLRVFRTIRLRCPIRHIRGIHHPLTTRPGDARTALGAINPS